MAWIEKQALKALVADFGATYSELQYEFTWYGRATFLADSAEVHCDFTLGGTHSVRRDDLIVRAKYTGPSSEWSDESRVKRAAALQRYEKEILVCHAALNWNPKLEGQKADKHAFQIVEITPQWSVAKVKLRSRIPLGQERNVGYLVCNGVFTSLPKSNE